MLQVQRNVLPKVAVLQARREICNVTPMWPMVPVNCTHISCSSLSDWEKYIKLYCSVLYIFISGIKPIEQHTQTHPQNTQKIKTKK